MMSDRTASARRRPFISQLVPFVLSRMGGDSSLRPARIVSNSVVMFADVSGFTALAERLALDGDRGAENVASRLDAHFDVMLDSIARWGGLVHGFAGDATIAIWPIPSDGDPSAARQAIACGLEIQSSTNATSDGANGLMPQRIALGLGDLVLDCVGGVDDRWALLAGGNVWEEVVSADDHARVGDVVVSGLGFETIVASATSTQLGAAMWRLSNVVAEAPVPGSIEPRDLKGAHVDAFVSVGLLRQITADHLDWLAEFRRVSTVFLLLHDGAPHVPLDEAQELNVVVQRAVGQYDGDLVYLRYDDKGLVALVAFGAAHRSHENDAVRALHLSSTVHRELGDRGRAIKVGVSTGSAFAGLVGGVGYREYTVHGDVVNRAARLMQSAAPGTTLCDLETRDSSQEAFDFDDLGALTLKGMSERIAAFRPAGANETSSRPHSVRLVGRVSMTAQLEVLIESLSQQVPTRAAHLVGEAGHGKSAILDHARRIADRRGATVLVGAGDSIRRAEPYAAWRQVFSGLSERDRALGDGEAYLERWMDDERAGLLSSVLVNAPGDSPFVSRLDASGRAEATREFVIEILSELPGDRPTVIVLDDVQWLDSASWQLLDLFVRRVPGALVLIASRPLDGAELPDEARRLLASLASTRMDVGPLSRAETDELVADRLGVESVSDELGRRIHERTEGHPLFTEQVVLSLSDDGAILVDGDGARSAPSPSTGVIEFPDGVEGVVMSRVDRLDAATQLTLKVASVAGRDFTRELVASVHPVESSVAELGMQFARLERARLIEREPGASGGYRFSHAIIRDVAYDVMLSAQQRDLHRRVADHLELDDATRASVLAHHWSRAGVEDRAVHHLDRAAREAIADHANAEARRFLLDVIGRSAERSDLADDDQRARWLHLLARAELNLGQYRDARHHLMDVVETLDTSVPTSTRRVASGLAIQIGRHVSVRRGRAAPIDDAELANVAADAYAMLAEIFYNDHQLESALYSTVAGANLALRSPGDSPVAAILQSNLAIAATSAPWLRQSDHYSAEARAMAARLDDPATWARVLLIVGTYEFGAGRWADAIDHYEGSIAAADECGERKLAETAAGGLGNVHRMLGRFEAANTIDRHVWNLGRDRGVAQSQVWGGYGRVSALCGLNRFEELAETLDDFGRLLDAPGTREQVSSSNVVAYLSTRALLELHQGRRSHAHDIIDQAIVELGRVRSLQSYMCCTTSYVHDAVMATWRDDPDDPKVEERASRLGRFARRCGKAFPIGRPRALMVAGDLHMMQGRVGVARRSWRRAARTAHDMSMPYDAAQAHQILATRAQLSRAVSDAHLRQSRSLLSSLALDQPFAWSV